MSSDVKTTEQMFSEVTFVQQTSLRIATNLRRVLALIDFVDSPLPKDSPPQTKDDILRAAVVFLHATLEDFLRYIGSKYIPSGGEEILNKIPVIGSSNAVHSEKFFLGKLAKHRDKTVDQLIVESVEANLDKRSFSDTTDIAQLLDSVGVPSDVVEKCYKSLSELMARRHEIVHKGDLKPTVNQEGERDPEPIDASKVREWFDTILLFTSLVTSYKLKAEA
jgi:hypothetical protein